MSVQCSSCFMYAKRNPPRLFLVAMSARFLWICFFCLNHGPFWFLIETTHLAMDKNPVIPVNIPIPTKIGSEMGGEFTYQPKWDPIGFDNHSNFLLLCLGPSFLGAVAQRPGLQTARRGVGQQGQRLWEGLLGLWSTSAKGCKEKKWERKVGQKWGNHSKF